MGTGSRFRALEQALQSVSHHGRLAKAQAEAGDFGQWCIEASEWVDLVVDLVREDQRFARREGLRTREEERRAVDEMSTELARLVRRETFEAARARLIGLEPRRSPSSASTTPTTTPLASPRLEPPHARAPLAPDTPPAHTVTRARPPRHDAPSARTAHPKTASYGDAARPMAPRRPDTRDVMGREGTDERRGEGMKEREDGLRPPGMPPPPHRAEAHARTPAAAPAAPVDRARSPAANGRGAATQRAEASPHARAPAPAPSRPSHRANARARTPDAALAAPVDGARNTAANGRDETSPRIYVPPHARAPAPTPLRPPHRDSSAPPAPAAPPPSSGPAAAAIAHAGATPTRDALSRRAIASPRALAAAPAPSAPVVPAAAIEVTPAASAGPPASTQGCRPAHTPQTAPAAAPTPGNVERRRRRSPTRVRTRSHNGTQRPPHRRRRRRRRRKLAPDTTLHVGAPPASTAHIPDFARARSLPAFRPPALVNPRTDETPTSARGRSASSPPGIQRGPLLPAPPPPSSSAATPELALISTPGRGILAAHLGALKNPAPSSQRRHRQNRHPALPGQLAPSDPVSGTSAVPRDPGARACSNCCIARSLVFLLRILLRGRGLGYPVGYSGMSIVIPGGGT
ncbi:hypothetical protein HWV62_1098 [Athelia sp. TMB]|nr:hypothetical protein HWV62_1098 [Athelia sp. TMB]